MLMVAADEVPGSYQMQFMQLVKLAFGELSVSIGISTMQCTVLLWTRRVRRLAVL